MLAKYGDLIYPVQMNICSPSGIDCFRQVHVPNLCLPPCEGLNFDVNVDKNIPSIKENIEFQPAYESYLKWKKGFSIKYTT